LAQAIWVLVLPRSRPVGISPSCSTPSPSLSARPEGQISPRTMSSTVFATLLAASLLQTCACDTQALRALVARKLKASMSPPPRSNARELREEADRRLSMQPSEACLAACPGLQTLQSDILMASTPLWQSSGSPFSLDENGESSAEAAAELVAGIMEITIDAFCTHRPAVQCVVDNPSACGEGSDEMILEFAPRLDCLCDACPSATPALAHLAGTFISSFATAFSGGFGTTTQAFFGPETTTDSGDGGLDDLTGLQMEAICAVYPLFSCATDHPAQCGGGILFGGIGDMQDITTDELALLEETCPSATTTSGTDDSSTTDEESESSTTDEETSNCGFISLGWLSASLPLVVAALRFEAAR